MSYRWNTFLKKTGIKITFIKALKIYFAGLFTFAYPARSGEFIRGIWMQSLFRINAKSIYTITFFERFQDLFSSLFLFLVCLNGIKSINFFFITIIYIAVLNILVYFSESNYAFLRNTFFFFKT